MSAITLNKIIVILIIAIMSTSAFVGFADNASAEKETPKTRASPEVFVATSTSTTNSVIYYYPFSGGAFGARTNLGTFGQNIYSVAVADFDGDLDYDILWGERSGSNLNFYVLKKNGPGPSFDPRIFIGSITGSLAIQIAVGDVNNDKKMDFITSKWYGGTGDQLVLFINQGSDVFTTKTVYTGGRNIGGKSLVDFDNDGHLDIVALLHYNDGNLYWLKGDGKGNFGSEMLIGPAGTTNTIYGIASGDFDLNGNKEVVFSGFTSPAAWYTYEYEGSMGSHRFGSFINYYASSSPRYNSKAFDFTGDGYPDLLISQFTGRLKWIKNNGYGSFYDFQDVDTISYSNLDPGAPVLLPTDADNDFFPDYWENIVGLNPSNPNEDNLDPDNDGLTNREEFEAGSNPMKADTDDDGVEDKWEVQYTTDPNNPDSDFDGTSDYDELFTFNSAPWTADSDSGGMIDGVETSNYFNTDPMWNPDDPIQITDTTTHSGNWFDHPDSATDSQHNTHIAFCRRYANDRHEIRYMMVDPASNILIRETTITTNDGSSSYRPQIAVDSNDKIHITWTDVRFGGRIAIYYIKLDPYRDDRNGNGANLGTITLVAEKLISNEFSSAGWQQTVHRMTMDSQDRVNILMPNGGIVGTYGTGIYFIQLNSIGNPTLSPTQIKVSDDYVQYMSQDLAADSNDDIHITYNAKREGMTLQGLWSMDENSGTTTADGSGNGNTGTLNNGPVWTTGKSGAAIDFDGVNDYVFVPNNPNLEVGINNEDFAVEYWFYLQQGATGGWRSLIHKGWNNNQRTFSMWMRPWDTRMHFRISTTSSWNEGSDSIASIPVNQWTHIAYVKIDNKLQLYFNGQLDNSVTLAGTVNYNTGPFYIGKSPWYAGTNCIIDDLRVYRGTVSSETVKSHYNGMYTMTQNRWGGYYMMVDGNDGSTIIDRTQISPGIPNGGQEIAVDSKDKVHIVWHQEDVTSATSPNLGSIQSSGANIVNHVSGMDDGLEADLTGDVIDVEWTNLPANQKTLTLVTRIVGQSTPFDIYVWDGIGWASAYSGTATGIGYIFAVNLNPYLPDPTGKIRVRYEPFGGGNIFLDFCGFKLGNALFPSVEVFYTKLDPSLDDQDGDASMDGQLTLIPDMRESRDDGIYSMWPTIAIDQMDEVHIPWYEWSGWTSQSAQRQDLVYIIQDEDALRLTPEIPLTPTGSLYAGATFYGGIYPTFPYIQTDMLDHSHIVWCDVRPTGGAYNIEHAWMNPDDDNDRLPIKGEYQYGTDWLDPDTDDDRLIDGAEVFDHGTDPLEPDSDYDMLKDGVEVLDENTDPLDKDTDDGGVPDGEEVLIYYTDPLDPADDVRSNEYFEVIDSSLDAQLENNGDTTGWTNQNLWHLVQNGQTSLNTIHNIVLRGQYAWWYGREATGTFGGVGTTAGSLTTPVFNAPVSDENIFFTFWSIWAVESWDVPFNDFMDVYILSNGGSYRIHVYRINPENYPAGRSPGLPLSSESGVGGTPMWMLYGIDITEFEGQNIQIEFRFDSVDQFRNDYMGWVVDDFRIAKVNPPDQEPEEPEFPGIIVEVGIDIPGGPSTGGTSSSKPSDYVYETDDIAGKGEEEDMEITTLDLFLIFFIIILAATLASSLQYQRKRAEALLKARCVSGNQTRLLDINDQMKEAMDMKKARRIRAGNLVEIVDVKGNTIEIATEIGSFFVPSDLLGCAEGVEDLERDRKKKKRQEQVAEKMLK